MTKISEKKAPPSYPPPRILSGNKKKADFGRAPNNYQAHEWGHRAEEGKGVQQDRDQGAETKNRKSRKRQGYLVWHKCYDSNDRLSFFSTKKMYRCGFPKFWKI